MVPKWIKKSALLALGCACFLTPKAARAVSKDLVDTNGVSSGWSVTIPDAQAADVSVTFQRETASQFFFTKTATIRNTTTPIILSFDKTSASAKALVIGDEAISNQSGSDWSGFRMILSSGSVGGTPNFAFTTSDGAPFPGTFSIDPFTTFTFVSTNTELDLGGGTVKAGTSWTPGSKTGTGLAIVTGNSSADHFTLKEMPTAGTGPGPTPIPLPTAAWTGLTTMLGLSLVGAGRKAYHKLF